MARTGYPKKRTDDQRRRAEGKRSRRPTARQEAKAEIRVARAVAERAKRRRRLMAEAVQRRLERV